MCIPTITGKKECVFFFFTFISYLYFICDNLSIIFINFPNQYLLQPHYMLCKIGGKDNNYNLWSLHPRILFSQ